jgi:hypothetical protein
MSLMRPLHSGHFTARAAGAISSTSSKHARMMGVFREVAMGQGLQLGA